MTEDDFGFFLGILLIVLIPVFAVWLVINPINRPAIDTSVYTYEITDVSHMQNGYFDDYYTVDYLDEDGNVIEQNINSRTIFSDEKLSVENTNLDRQWMDKQTKESGLTYYTLHVKQPVRSASAG